MGRDPGGLRALAVRLAVRVYRIGLFRYSRPIREEFGDDMTALFARMLWDAHERGSWIGLGAVCIRTVRDWFAPLPRVPECPGTTRNRRGQGPSGTRRLQGTGGGMVRASLEDARLAVRSLVREPRLTIAVVSVLAIGIALVAGVYSVVEAYLVRPLPFPHPDRIVSVQNARSLSWDGVDDVFERAVSWDLDVFTVVGEGPPELLRGSWITPDFLDLYGIVPVLGRGFLPEEADRYAAPVAMISHDLWSTRFGSDPGVVGATFRAFTSDRPEHAEVFTIVGVLPADLWYVNDYTDVFAPIRGTGGVYTGRLHAHLSLERASQILTELDLAGLEVAPAGHQVELVPLRDDFVADVRSTLLALQGAVLVVLLVACMNGGLLLLIRTARRERELSMRRALGASGLRVARQVLIEGVLLGATAGGVGAFLAVGGLELVRSGLEESVGRAVPGGVTGVAVDGSVLLLAAGLSVLIGILFGLAPLLVRAGGRPFSSRAAVESGGDTRRRRRVRGGLVAVEVALSLALLTGAGLLVRSAIHLQTRDPGFDAAGVVRGVAGIRAASHPNAADRVVLFSRLAEEVRGLPGVQSVGLVSRGLFTGRLWPSPIEAQPDGITTHARAVRWSIDESYFDALRVPVLQGRGFQRSDAAGTETVVVVSESLAASLWPDGSAVGQRLRMPVDPGGDMGTPEEEPWRRVVGVVPDVQGEVRRLGVGDVYEPYRQGNPQWMNVVVRGSLSVQEVTAGTRAALAGLDPDAPFYNVVRLDRAVDEALRPSRDLAWMLTLFSAFAFLLAILGLYGVVSYAARQSRRSVAIRIALGAERASVTRLFVREALTVVVVGIVLGGVGGLGFARVLVDQLHGVRVGDPLIHGGLAITLLAAAVVAVWIPARSAAHADPAGLLREE